MTAEEKRERNRLKMKRYRDKHREKVRAYDRLRQPRKQAKEREKTFAGKRCGACNINLAGRYGAYGGTRLFCRECRDNKGVQRALQRERTRRWRTSQMLQAR